MLALLATLLVTSSAYSCGRVGDPIACLVHDTQSGDAITIHVDSIDLVTGLAKHVVVDLPDASYDLGDGFYDGTYLHASDGSVTISQKLSRQRRAASGRGAIWRTFWTDDGGTVEVP